jgi:hypothetical protein
VPRTCARDGYEPSRTRLTMIGGDGCSPLQRVSIGIASGPCQQEDVTARHASNVEPPIVRFSDVEAESVVVRIATTGQDLPSTRQGVVKQSGIVVWVTEVWGIHSLSCNLR